MSQKTGFGGLKTIVAASAAGTTFEWYDFFIFGTLTATIAKTFFANAGALGTVLALATFAVGFIARPVGALVFGHIGDRKGRKGTFLYTILVMGLATVAIGLLPTHAQIGNAAPLLLVALRLIQGFALGGEYGGAAIYVAEHAPANRRGTYTSWIQGSASFGLIAALIVILLTRRAMTPEAFEAWGWRIPFIVSAGLLAVSVYIRARTAESPAFKALHEAGQVAKAPMKEIFTRGRNLKGMLIALFGFMTAQGVVWYTTFFYTQVFLTAIVRIDPMTMNVLIMVMALISSGLYIGFAALSDRIGRKPVMIFGIVLASVSFFPGFHALMSAGNPGLDAAMKRAPVTIVADPAQCHFQFDLLGTGSFTSPCDVARNVVAGVNIPYVSHSAPGAAEARIEIGAQTIPVGSAAGLDKARIKAMKADVSAQLKRALTAAGYPDKADPAKSNHLVMLIVLLLFAVGACALYGPMAALLVEMFPTRVRYTALSLPYNIGTGWFGGLQPALSFAMVAASGDLYFGLWYPVITGGLAALVALLFLKETHGRDLHAIE